MALYPTTVNTDPLTSDVNQLVNSVNGTHDIGQIVLAPPISAPDSSGFSLATQSGGNLGVGNYQYAFSYVTGQYKSDGTTLVKTSETTVSSALPVTTTSGNTSVQITLPGSGIPSSAVAINIYRTTVGGSAFGLVATVKVGSVSYIDSTADGSLGAAPPTDNTTGTNLQFPVQTTLPPILPAGTMILVNGTQYISNGTQWLAQSIGGTLYLYNNAWGGF